MMPSDQEMCPVCDYCKFVDQICTKCRLYINQDLTPTEKCITCGEQKLKASVCCFHDHDLIKHTKMLMSPNPCAEIVIDGSPFTIKQPSHSFIFYDPVLSSRVEILKISEDGFWVRGVKVEQGENEAKEVYETFKNLLGYK